MLTAKLELSKGNKQTDTKVFVAVSLILSFCRLKHKPHLVSGQPLLLTLNFWERADHFEEEGCAQEVI